MKFILILWFFYDGSISALPEFNSLKACENALYEVQSKHRKGVIHGICVAKGESNE